MIYTNERTGDFQHVSPTPPCCTRAIVQTLLRTGYKPSDRAALAYVERLKSSHDPVTGEWRRHTDEAAT